LIAGALIACGFAGALALAGDSKPPPADFELFANPVVAKGDGFEIRQNEVDDMVSGLNATLSSTRGQTIPDAQRRQIRNQMLDRLLLIRMLQQRATDEDRTKAQAAADQFVANTKAKARSEESYRRQLTAAGIKPALFETRAFEQALVETVLSREIKSKVVITDEQLREFYQEGIDLPARQIRETLSRLEQNLETNTPAYTENQTRLADLKKANLARVERPDRVKMRMVFLSTRDRASGADLPDDQKAAKRAKAQQAVDRSRAGEDFAALIRELSEDPDLETTGGEYTLSRESVTYPELRGVLFGLSAGQVSEVVETKAGYNVVQVLERLPGGRPTLEEIEKDLRELLAGQEMQQRLPAYFDQLKKDYHVDVTSSP